VSIRGSISVYRITAWGWNPQPRLNKQGLLANSLMSVIHSG